MNGSVNSQGGFRAELVGEITQVNKGNGYLECKGQEVDLTNYQELTGVFDTIIPKDYNINVKNDIISRSVDTSGTHCYKYGLDIIQANNSVITSIDGMSYVLRFAVNNYFPVTLMYEYKDNLYFILAHETYGYVDIARTNDGINWKYDDSKRLFPYDEIGHIFSYCDEDLDNVVIAAYDNSYVISVYTTNDLTSLTQRNQFRLSDIKPFELFYSDKYVLLDYYDSKALISTDAGINWTQSRFICNQSTSVSSAYKKVKYKGRMYATFSSLQTAKMLKIGSSSVGLITFMNVYNNNFSQIISFCQIGNKIVLCSQYAGSSLQMYFIDKPLDELSSTTNEIVTHIRSFSTSPNYYSEVADLWINKGSLFMFNVDYGTLYLFNGNLKSTLPYYNNSAYIRVKSAVGGGQLKHKISVHIFLQRGGRYERKIKFK